MNELLKRRPAKASKVGASSAFPKAAVDAMLTEMARPGVGTTYDRDYQTKHENPFADSRFDAVPELEAPKTSAGAAVCVGCGQPIAQDEHGGFLDGRMEPRDGGPWHHKCWGGYIDQYGFQLFDRINNNAPHTHKPQYTQKLPPPPSKTSKVDFLTDKVDGKDRVIAPGAHDVSVRSEQTQNALDAEQAKDEEGYLTRPKQSSYDFEFDRDRKIARKVASNRYLQQYVEASDIKTSNDVLMVNIPRGKFAQIEITPTTLARMEREIGRTLNVRAKFAQTVLTSGFDGISFEFVMV